MIFLTQRDLRLIQLCWEHQFLTLEHFERAFGGTCERVARRRAQELVDGGYLLRKPSPVPERRHYFRLGRKAQEIALGMKLVESPPRRHVNLNQFGHDALLTCVRQRIDELWDADFKPERAIKQESFYGTVPDGIYTFDGGGRIAIEVEASDKGKRRFTKLLHRWDSLNKVYFVIYVASTEHMAARLQKYIVEADPSQRVGVVTWDELQAKAPVVWGPPNHSHFLFDTRNPIPQKGARQ